MLVLIGERFLIKMIKFAILANESIVNLIWLPKFYTE